MESLIRHIKNYISLDRIQEEMISSKIKSFTPDKKEIIESYNTIYQHIYFVNAGCLHLYQVTEKGDVQTIQFAIKNWWLTDFDSFNAKVKSMYNIQALEKSEVVALHKNDLDYLLSEIPMLERYFRFIAERAYAATLYRISLMMNFTKEERYLNFINRFPEFAQQVPQFVLGSYLGISAEYISEIRKKSK